MESTSIFSKYSGCGNHFLILENLEENFPKKNFSWIQHLSSQTNCDGILLVEPSHPAPFKMEIINADGSIAEMCGNGLRCFVDYLVRKGKIKEQSKIETRSGVLSTFWQNGNIEIEMPKPSTVKWDLKIALEEQIVTGHYLIVGVPHFVIQNFIGDFSILAPLIRNHLQFKPKGSNVNWLFKKNVITYERGVEGITNACGTGIVAAYLTLMRHEKAPFPMTFFPKSGEPLIVKMRKNIPYLSGPATLLFEGDLTSYIIHKQS